MKIRSKNEEVMEEFRKDVMKYEEVTRKRIERLINMDEHIRMKTNDEDCFMTWIYEVPDEASLEDYEDIAVDDENYFHVCELFAELILYDNERE